jgi:hypothetical protein
MARPADLDHFVFDKVSANVADTPAATHIAQSVAETVVPPGLNIAPPATDALSHFADALAHVPALPEDATDHGHLPGWLLPGI